MQHNMRISNIVFSFGLGIALSRSIQRSSKQMFVVDSYIRCAPSNADDNEVLILEKLQI